jgi:signal transduction histidine kinase
MRQRVLAFASRWRDELITAVALVTMEVNVLTIQHGEGDREPSRLLDALGATAFALPLLWRRRAPFPAAVAMVGVGMIQAIWLTAPPDLVAAIPAVVVMMFALGFHGGRLALPGIVICAGLAVAIAAIYDPSDIFFPVVFFFIAPWAGGRAMHNRLLLTRELAEKAARLEHEREERAARAVADERARIARELHDVVAHSLTVMVIQAGAARRLVDRDPERVTEVAATIKQMGREALDEMRRLVGVLHEQPGQPELAPQPTMADVDALVERARGAGLEVELEVVGERSDLPPGIDLSAYRVVQEALTNTVKHANARRASVTVRYGADELELTITDDGAGAHGSDDRAVPGGGHGLVGMRERVSLYGGELQAGARKAGGFEVRARFPLKQEAYA